jgi:hypothetical protein
MKVGLMVCAKGCEKSEAAEPEVRLEGWTDLSPSSQVARAPDRPPCRPAALPLAFVTAATRAGCLCRIVCTVRRAFDVPFSLTHPRLGIFTRLLPVAAVTALSLVSSLPTLPVVGRWVMKHSGRVSDPVAKGLEICIAVHELS